MTYHPRVPGDWRKMQRIAIVEMARRQRALARLKRRRWRLVLDFFNIIFWSIAHVLFWLFVAVVVFAAICGFVLSWPGADRRRGRC